MRPSLASSFSARFLRLPLFRFLLSASLISPSKAPGGHIALHSIVCLLFALHTFFLPPLLLRAFSLLVFCLLLNKLFSSALPSPPCAKGRSKDIKTCRPSLCLSPRAFALVRRPSCLFHALKVVCCFSTFPFKLTVSFRCNGRACWSETIGEGRWRSASSTLLSLFPLQVFFPPPLPSLLRHSLLSLASIFVSKKCFSRFDELAVELECHVFVSGDPFVSIFISLRRRSDGPF